MQTTIKTLLFTVLLLSGISVSAQKKEKERITNFHSNILIHTDGKITVAESITIYAAGKDIRRGIIRSIPLYRTDTSGKDQRMDIHVISVTRNGESEDYKIEDSGGNREIYLGNSNVMLTTGQHEYIITYETYGHVGFFDEFDELYWNVTGNDWAFSIDKASASIILPEKSSAINTACYTGTLYSTASNCSVEENESMVTFRTNGSLSPGEGLTVAASFPRDIIKRPPPPTELELFWEKYKNIIFASLSIIILGCFYFFTWLKVGKDPEKQLVVPTFLPPHKWSPAVIRYLYNKGYDNTAFTAALVNMAVNNGIRIKHEKKKYRLEKTGNKTKLSEEEKKIYDTLFKGRESILVSDNHHSIFSSASTKLKNALENGWNIKNYFLHNRKYVVTAALMTFVLLVAYMLISGTGVNILPFMFMSPFIIVGLSFLVVGIKNRKKGCTNIIIAIIGAIFALPALFVHITFLLREDIVTCIFLIIIFASFFIYLYLIKAPTELGAKTEAELEGFLLYLKTAEENRLNLLTPPERTPELFEELLPYAIALDVENEWGNKFDEVLKQADYQPDWYNDTKPFRYTMLTSALSSSLGSSVKRAQVDPSSSSGSSGSGGWNSGSGGGGFSGGGGGGGGGRGW